MKEPIHPFAVYTIEQAATLLDVVPETLRRYIRSGKLQATTFGKIHRLTGTALLSMMELAQTEFVTTMDRVRQVENSNYIKAKSYLLTDQKGQKYLNVMDLAANTLLLLLDPEVEKVDEDELTIRYIGSRMFNSALAAYHDLLSGFYQISFSNQRDLIETQFLLDLFRSDRSKVTEWRESTPQERKQKFSTVEIRKILDERDGFKSHKRAERYGKFSNFATHMSYTGFQLIANSENLIEIGPFYDEKKILNTMHELALNLGYGVTGLMACIKTKKLASIQSHIKLAEALDDTFNFNVTQSENFQNVKAHVEQLVEIMLNEKNKTA